MTAIISALKTNANAVEAFLVDEGVKIEAWAKTASAPVVAAFNTLVADAKSEVAVLLPAAEHATRWRALNALSLRDLPPSAVVKLPLQRGDFSLHASQVAAEAFRLPEAEVTLPQLPDDVFFDLSQQVDTPLDGVVSTFACDGRMSR